MLSPLCLSPSISSWAERESFPHAHRELVNLGALSWFSFSFHRYSQLRGKLNAYGCLTEGQGNQRFGVDLFKLADNASSHSGADFG
jgi:hypothetical protein